MEQILRELAELKRRLAKLEVLESPVSRQFYTLSSSADTTGPSGSGFLLHMRDNTNGGTVLVLYEYAQTPVIISQSGPTTYVTAAPGATEIQVKNKAAHGGVDFRAGSSRNGAGLHVIMIMADAD